MANQSPLAISDPQSNWHISGIIGDYSGFGLFFDNCSRIDASAYRGIQFTISGSVPQGNIVTLGMGTLDNTIAASWLNAHGNLGAVNPGRCIPTSGTNQYDQMTCVDATRQIPVTLTPTVVMVLWTDFTGGRPEIGVTPTGILSIYWFLPVPAGAGTVAPTAYPVDIVIDDLSFIP